MDERHPLADALFGSSKITDKELAEAHRLSAHRIEHLCSVLTEIGGYEVEDHASASDLRSVLRYLTRIAQKAVA